MTSQTSASLRLSVRVVLDWLTCRIPVRLPSPIDGGKFVKLNRAGAIESSTPLRLKVPGSYSSSLTIRAPSTGELEISGNPAKWLAGHNLYGTDCPKTLLWATLERLATIREVLPWSLAEIGLCGPSCLDDTVITRADVNRMFLLDRPADVPAFVRAASLTGAWGHRGKGAFKEGTVVYGRTSMKNRARSELILYDKGAETARHPLPPVMAEDQEVVDWVRRCLRVELKLFRLTLKEMGLDRLGNWSEGIALQVWRQAVGKLTFSDAAQRDGFDLENLPKAFRATFLMWESGRDCRKLLSKPTYHRHRGEIRSLTGVDISLPPAPRETPNVVPLKRVLEARFVDRPVWAGRIENQLRDGGAMIIPFAA